MNDQGTTQESAPAEPAIQDAPVQTTGSETSSTQTSEASTQTEPNSDEKEQKRRDNGFQRRINEIVKDRENYKAMAERERQERLRIMDLLEKSRGEPVQTNQKSGKEAPKVESFERYEDYLDARAEWVASRHYEQRAHEMQKQQEQAKHQQLIADQQRHVEAQRETLRTLVERAEEKYPDFYEKVFTQDLPISPVVGQAILESDAGQDVAYYLATHPDEAQRIAKLSPTSQLREFGKIEVSLSKPQSAAPPPINPLSGKKANDLVPTGEEKDFKDFLAKRYRQLGRK